MYHCYKYTVNIYW